ncbi:uncharacterized [Tachysurus ichikawai]
MKTTRRLPIRSCQPGTKAQEGGRHGEGERELSLREWGGNDEDCLIAFSSEGERDQADENVFHPIRLLCDTRRKCEAFSRECHFPLTASSENTVSRFKQGEEEEGTRSDYSD